MVAHSHSSSADVNAPLPKQAGLQLRLPAVNNAARRFNFAPSSPPSPSSRQHPRRFHQAPWASHAAGSASHDQRGIPRMRIVSQPSASHSHHGCIPVPDSRGIALPCSALSRPPETPTMQARASHPSPSSSSCTIGALPSRRRAQRCGPLDLGTRFSSQFQDDTDRTTRFTTPSGPDTADQALDLGLGEPASDARRCDKQTECLDGAWPRGAL